MLLTAIALDAARDENKKVFKRTNNVIEANYTLGTGLPLREVKEGKDVGYRSQLLGSVHQVEFLVTPKYQGIKVNIKFDEVKVYPEGYCIFQTLLLQELQPFGIYCLKFQNELLSCLGWRSRTQPILLPNHFLRKSIRNISS